MHPEIEEALNNAGPEFHIPNTITLRNAEKLLNYMEDINLERTGKFEPTPADSLYMLWNIDDWEFHIECLKNGKILYTFRKGGDEKASGSYPLDKFIPQLERYLLIGNS